MKSFKKGGLALPHHRDKKQPTLLANAEKSGPYSSGFKKPIESKNKKVVANEKNETRYINTSMSKSIFDQLVEEYMGDEESLGIDPGNGEGDLGSGEGDIGGEGDETVTITLPKAQAQEFLDLLQAALGDAFAEDPTEDGSGEGDEPAFGENVEIQELKKDGKVLQGKNNRVGSLKPQGGSADSGKVPAVDTGSKGPAYKKGDMKVGGKISKSGVSAFEL